METDFDGNLYISDNIYPTPTLYRVDNDILHAQEIRGTIFNDENNNCVFDNNESQDLQSWKLILNNGRSELVNFSSDGSYSFKVPQGNYTLTILPPSDRWSVCESSYDITINQNGQVEERNFAASAEMICADFKVNVNNHLLRRCFSGRYTVDIQNTGTTEGDNVFATISVDPFLEIVEANQTFETVNDTTIRFDLGHMKVLETRRLEVKVVPSCNSDIGYLHCFTADVTATNLCSDSQTSSTLNYVPNTGPFDPNDMRVFSETGHEALHFGQEDYQYYHVRFQNVGTDTAINVRAISVLDKNLDLETMEILGASHNYDVSFNDGQNLVMSFPQIMLPDSTVNNEASNGYFRFRIKPVADIALGAILNCNSEIYFDFNAAVITNQTTAIIGEPCAEPVYFHDVAAICFGENYAGYDRTGMYRDVLESSTGCDSIRTLDLTRFFNTTFTTRINACEGQTVDGISTNTIVLDSLTNIAGCDSIERKDYRFLPVAAGVTIFDQTICYGEEFLGHTEPGTYLDTIMLGFTSCRVQETVLQILPKIESTFDTLICPRETYLGLSPGTYMDTLSTVAFGCDSIEILNLFSLPDLSATIDTTICEGEEFKGFSQTGNYSTEWISNDGCLYDTIINLTVVPLETQSCLVSVEDISQLDQTAIYPVPVHDFLNISLEQTFKGYDIIDLRGQTIKSERFKATTEKRISATPLSAGIYILRVQTKNGQMVGKFVKN